MIRKRIFMMRVHWNRVKTKKAKFNLDLALGSANRLIWSPGLKWLHLEVYFNSFDMDKQAFLWYLGWKASQPKRTVQNNGLRPLFRPYVIYLKMLGSVYTERLRVRRRKLPIFEWVIYQWFQSFSVNGSQVLCQRIIKLMRRVQNN